MNEWLNNVVYGNPTDEQLGLILPTGIVCDLFPELKEHDFPVNNSPAVKDEIMALVGFRNDIKVDQNAHIRQRYIAYDQNLMQVLIVRSGISGPEIYQLLSQIKADIDPLIMKLKFHYQRPRPSQLAKYYKVKLFPHSSENSLSPSYPSASMIYTSVITSVLMSKNNIEDMTPMINDVEYSRLYLGLNYPSDIDFSYIVAERILAHPEFRKKYLK